MSDFFDEYKKRSIYGDALGPPTNATQAAAREILNMQKGHHGFQASPGSRDFTFLYYKGQPVTTSFRFSTRRSLAYLLGGVAVATLGTVVSVNSSGSLQGLANIIGFPGFICMGIGTFRLATNFLFFALQIFAFIWKLWLKMAVIGSLGGLLSTAIIPLPVYICMMAGAVIGGFIGLVRARDKKERV